MRVYSTGGDSTRRGSGARDARVFPTLADARAMLDLVAPRYRLAEQRRWIADAKELYRAKIRMAFMMGDANGDGMLSLAEFKEAVATHRGERAGARFHDVHAEVSTTAIAKERRLDALVHLSRQGEEEFLDKLAH